MPDLKKEPFVRVLSENVDVLYGFSDGHAKLKVRTPLGVVVPVNLSKDEILKIKDSFDRAYLWATRPDEERQAGKGDLGGSLDPRAKISYGHPDGHVTISVRVVPKISPWIPLEISRSELLEGKKAMDEVSQWANLPEDVRKMQGVP